MAHEKGALLTMFYTLAVCTKATNRFSDQLTALILCIRSKITDGHGQGDAMA